MMPSPLPNNSGPRPGRPIGYLLIGIVVGLLLAGGLFMLLTTTLAKPEVLTITLPPKENPGPVEPAPANALTIILGGPQRYYYYAGPDPAAAPGLRVATSAGALRALLLARRPDSAAVFIKPGPRSSYKDMVAILDEMNLVGQQKYALLDLTAADRQALPAAER